MTREHVQPTLLKVSVRAELVITLSTDAARMRCSSITPSCCHDVNADVKLINPTDSVNIIARVDAEGSDGGDHALRRCFFPIDKHILTGRQFTTNSSTLVTLGKQ